MIVEIGGKTLYISDRQSDDFGEPKFLLIQPVSQSDIDKEASFKFAVSVSEIVRSNFVWCASILLCSQSVSKD